MKKVFNETTEFSFIVKPSQISGVGVFATHDISKETYLRLTAKGGETRRVKLRDIPKEFLGQVDHISEDEALCPLDFGHMWICWYVNHSKNPNAVFNAVENNFYALLDIKKGDEITIDYNGLGEPDAAKASYY